MNMSKEHTSALMFEMVKGLENRGDYVNFYGFCFGDVSIGYRPIKIEVTKVYKIYDCTDTSEHSSVRMRFYDLRNFRMVQLDGTLCSNPGTRWNLIRTEYPQIYEVNWSYLDLLLTSVRYKLKELEFSLAGFIDFALSGRLKKLSIEEMEEESEDVTYISSHYRSIVNQVVAAELCFYS